MVQLNAARVRIEGEGDIVTVRRAVREAAASVGFGITDVTRIVTAASELARNIVTYAAYGELTYTLLTDDGGQGLEMVFEDRGPGIADVDRAMSVGYTTSGGLGLGLPGTKRLMDEMEIITVPDRLGTRITVRKWLRRN
jgi:serine/threonine-protein kinase RsbT